MARFTLVGIPDPDRFADNLQRVMGVHRLSSNATAALLGITPATLSSWLNGRASPNLHRAISVAQLFRINTERFLQVPFSDLLAHELADPERFEQVEREIHARRGPPDRRTHGRSER